VVEPLRPARGGFLRPFGCGWFIREFLLGHGPNESPRIDPNVGAPQADIFYHYKTAFSKPLPWIEPLGKKSGKLGNVREQDIVSIWKSSPVLARLRQRELLKGECGQCSYKIICSGCRGRAYEETGDMMASDPGCWLALTRATKIEGDIETSDVPE